MQQGLEGGLWPTASRQLTPACSHLNLGVALFPGEPSIETTALADNFIAACEALKQRAQLSRAGGPGSQKWSKKKCCKPLIDDYLLCSN